MMKFYILALVFVVAAQAADFRVKDKNDTCLRLQLEGSVDLTNNKTTVSLSFNTATMIDSSNCTLIKLDLTKSVEVWFQFYEISGEWEVIPVAQFVPHTVFGDEINSTVPVTYSSRTLQDHFKKNESYKCLAVTELKFNPDSKPEFTITVTAKTTNFTIQSLHSTDFVAGEDCPADKPVPTTTPTPTTKPTPVTTPQPSFKQNFSCEAENATQFRVLGSFALEITYNTTDGKTKKVHIDVPQVQHDNETDCSSKFNETLVFKFFGNWSIEYIFKLETPKSQLLGATQKYYVSNITVTYVHDTHLPNSSARGSVGIAHFSQPNYLEASTAGYYTCRDINLIIDQHVTMITKDFKYKAFNEKGDITFGKDQSITECPGDEETSSVVPIAVGAALAGLVVIVLIAYLIGRRRSRKAGYESV